MTFGGFDAAPLIEAAGFSAAEPAIAHGASADDAGTLDAALREAARAERTAARAEACLADLWIGQQSGPGLRAIEPRGHDAGTSWRAWMAPADDEAILALLPEKAKEPAMRAAYGDEKEEEEIVVKGYKPKTAEDESGWAGFWSGGGAGSSGEGTGDSGGGTSESSLVPIEERVTIDESVPADQRARAELAEAKLEAEMREFADKINGLADNAIVMVGDRTMTGAELKAAFAALTFVITSGIIYPNASGSNTNGVVRIDLNSLEGLLNMSFPWGDWGTNWLFLHELSHLTQIDRAFQDMQWSLYLTTDSTPTVEEFRQTMFFTAAENFTNSLAEDIGDAIDAPTGTLTSGGFS